MSVPIKFTTTNARRNLMMVLFANFNQCYLGQIEHVMTFLLSVHLDSVFSLKCLQFSHMQCDFQKTHVNVTYKEKTER